MALSRHNSEMAFGRHQTKPGWAWESWISGERKPCRQEKKGNTRGMLRGEANLTRQGEWGKSIEGRAECQRCAFW